MLFGKKRKQAAKEPEPTFVFTVPYSDHFRGYKQVGLSTYGDKEVEANLEVLKNVDSFSEITFKEYRFPNTNPLLRVYADGNKIGTIWSNSVPEYYKLILNRRVEKASFATDGLGNAVIFIKIKQ
jgi:hypothetical protein